MRAPRKGSFMQRGNYRLTPDGANLRGRSSHKAVPPLPCAPGASPFRIKGLAYRGVVRAVSKLVAGGVDRFCESLEDVRLREFVRQPFLATGLYDILPMYPLTAQLAGLLGAPYKDFLREGIHEQARYDATHVFHRMYDGAAVEEMPTRITRFEAQYYDFGRSDSSLEGPGASSCICTTRRLTRPPGSRR